MEEEVLQSWTKDELEAIPIPEKPTQQTEAPKQEAASTPKRKQRNSNQQLSLFPDEVVVPGRRVNFYSTVEFHIHDSEVYF